MPAAEPDTTTAPSQPRGVGEPLETTREISEPAEPRRAAGLHRGEALGRYLVLDVLGQGGMGVVYAAYDPELDRKVAIKLVGDRAARGRSSTEHSRLQREAQALAKLNHPNVVGVYDVGTWEQSVFVAMELVEGETVARWIERRYEEAPPTWREVLAILIPAGRGLEAAHAAGIVHRDFKPHNVMLSSSGQVTVLDFGLARAREGGVFDEIDGGTSTGGLAARSLTTTGAVMGTPAYMAPEQLRGETAEAASDQFAFCVTLFQALHGRRPFAGATLAEITQAVLAGVIVAPINPRVPSWLSRVVAKGLAVDPRHRHPSMTELLAQLERDPGRSRTQWIVGLGAVLGLGVAAWRVGTHDDPCTGVDDAMAQVWGSSRRAALEQAFRREAKAYSEQALVRVTSALDRHATRWVEERRATCEAGVSSGPDAGLRAACLDLRLQRFDALVRLLGDADQAMVAKAVSAVQDLADPADCRDGRSWREATPVPDEAVAQEQVESLRLRMDEVRARVAVGRARDARADAEAILVEARALGFAPAVAEAISTLGALLTTLGEFGSATPLLEEGLLLARAHGLERLESELLSPLVFLHVNATGALELADWHARVQQVLVERERDPGARARALADRARIEQERGRLAEAAELLERAAALYEEDASDSRVVSTLADLAWALAAADRHDEAERVIGRAEEIATVTLGSEHPFHANLLVQAARIDESHQRHADAADKLRRALALFTEAYGEDHPSNASVLNALGLQLWALGRRGESIDAHRRAIAVLEHAVGPDSYELTVLQANLGESLRVVGQAEDALSLHRAALDVRERLGSDAMHRYQGTVELADDLRALERCEEAEAQYEAALALHGATGGTSELGAARAYLGLGACAQQRGQPERARQHLEQAVTLGVEELGEDPWSQQVLASSRFALALALRETEPERASTLARQAREHWSKDPVQHGIALHEVDEWLAGRPASMPPY